MFRSARRFLSCLVFALPGLAHAYTACVGTADELDAAMSQATTSTDPSITIRIREGTYAAGGGNASLSVARTGATVVFTEFSYRQTNALPFRDNEFDAVISAIGVTFTPDHRTAASELVRVCRPGGTIGVISWTLEGFFGQMLAAISPYRRRGPLRVPMSALWGREPYVRALLGNRVRGVGMRRGVLEVSRFNSAEDVHGYLKTHFGPMIEVFESIGDDPLLAAELDHRLIEIAQDYMVDGAIEWEYLLVTATKR